MAVVLFKRRDTTRYTVNIYSWSRRSTVSVVYHGLFSVEMLYFIGNKAVFKCWCMKKWNKNKSDMEKGRDELTI